MLRNLRSRNAANMSPCLRKKLDLYTIAASAAGVGVLALAHPAQAEIIYTAANVSMTRLGPYPVDLNNDGTADFQFDHGTAATTGGGWSGITLSRASTYAAASNGVAVTAVGRNTDALALPAGQGIGPHRNFNRFGMIVGETNNIFSHYFKWEGQWANQGKGLKNRYAGVKFLINGEVHYGWIRVSVSTNGESFTATMTGYAYETIANKPILAGATKESDEDQSSAALDATLPSPATLGALALGAPGLSMWRPLI